MTDTSTGTTTEAHVTETSQEAKVSWFRCLFYKLFRRHKPISAFLVEIIEVESQKEDSKAVPIPCRQTVKDKATLLYRQKDYLGLYDLRDKQKKSFTFMGFTDREIDTIEAGYANLIRGL